MTTSTHYGLKLVQGTDIVNPLDIDKPNYEAIDTAMYNNECASIGSATELKTGTIHAITRANSDQNVFKFHATSNFESGDTFTVDGNAVTGAYINGASLKDRCFIIGSDVLCVLYQSQLTVIAPFIQNAQEVPFDDTSVEYSASNVQTAIEEASTATGTSYATGESVKERIDNLFAREVLTASESTTITGNGSASIYIPFAKNGYTPLTISGFSTGNVNVFALNVAFTSTAVRLDIHNTSSNAVSVTPSATVVYTKIPA